MRDTPVRWPMRDARLWEMSAYEIAVYGMYTPGDMHVYEAAPIRDRPMRWPMEDTRL